MHCVVIGSGLAGAAVASSLASRGWEVTVLDAAEAPAAGASGLPAGLLAPHFSSDDNLLSRLSRIGVSTTLGEARRLLREGIDWQMTGVLERRNSVVATSALPQAGAAWSRHASAEELRAAGLDESASALWHAQAAWIRPSALVHAWLAEPGITWRGSAAVAKLARDGTVWRVLDAQGRELAAVPLVVVAAAIASASIAASDITLHPVRGQVSFGPRREETRPNFPINGNGHYIPAFMSPEGPAWISGSTFDRGDTAKDIRGEDHQRNLARLRELLPSLDAEVADAFETGTVQGWAGIRCASTTRRPIAAQIDKGLWLSTAMGSRGLTFAKLCAELIAARIHAEPLPLDAQLAAALDPRPAPRPSGKQ